MPSNPHFYIILNQVAGTGQGAHVWPKIKAQLNQKKIQYDLQLSRYAGHTYQLAYQFAKFKYHDQLLLIIGGDGTLNQALNGLYNAHRGDIPIAYIPCGSGNDFARGVGISHDPIKALEQILAASTPTEIDLGYYYDAIKHDHGYFVNNVGIGFDANVVSTTNHSRNKYLLNRLHLGKLAYVSSLIKVFMHQDAFDVLVHAGPNYHHFKHGFLVTTTNHPYFGGGVPIMPSATVNNHQLDLIVIEKLNPFFFCYLFIMMLCGRHTRYRAVHHFEGPELTVQTRTLEFGQMDGEELGSRTFDVHFSVQSQAFWLNRE
ncbi:diacylglycerol/lipid kinase family protein [Latilactobacillus graminis]|uniref:Diacylglycerol kinase catalytic domain protein n=2 Tax=Latilactobacillus graminis TaxID=60519 RepID=A0AA89I1H1_9LACO|nr:diacylglycerol kinase family protein [Latilactobacillus graminis]KRM23860.1 diacylglycerol kinase catalytic domain protein [Latilactobacillus graminis DSM 20719]QFP79750.1 diacylglycerol kinase family lipid kinase [Latilactobacillus graminis]